MKRELNCDFRCMHCGAYVVSDPAYSAVRHRNHCPYCLWSRHLDHWRAGDRLSACKAPMKPLGLTFKQSPKRYNHGNGELMLCHQCTDCGTVSINRIAADDDPDRLYALLNDDADTAWNIDKRVLVSQIRQAFIQVLNLDDREQVHARLFGLVS